MEIGDIPADFQVGTHNGVLFLRYLPLLIRSFWHALIVV
jgi:hypothetical protein